ncbi:hypothetical protein DMUE_5831, partial [Dictyocoela muelleri]
FIKSQRGNDLIILNNFIYNFEKYKDNISQYRCQNRQCRARLEYYADKTFKIKKEHSHPPNEQKCIKLIIMSKIANRAKETNEKSCDIITKFTNKIDDNAIKALPTFKSLRNKINRVRQPIFNYQQFINEDIPEFLKNNLRSERFLIFDSGLFDNDRILIFKSPIMNKLMLKSKVFVVDGTFKAVPEDFYQ